MQSWQFWVKAFPPRLAGTSVHVKELQCPNQEPCAEGDFVWWVKEFLVVWLLSFSWPLATSGSDVNQDGFGRRPVSDSECGCKSQFVMCVCTALFQSKSHSFSSEALGIFL